MITIAAVLMILLSLGLTVLSWSRYGWSQSYWIVFGSAILVLVLLTIKGIS